MNKKLNNIIRLDLFKLHDANDNSTNWIFARGRNLKAELKRMIDLIGYSKTHLVKHLMRKFNISIASAERLVYLKKAGDWYPLVFIEELVTLSKSPRFKIQDEIEFLKSSKPPVVEYKAVKELTINLCKIAGAHAADGTLRDKYLCVTERYKDTMIALIKWFNDFNYTPKLFKISKNEYGIRFHSRIISRYFTKFFDFPSGCKQYNVTEPKIIRNSPLEFRKAFALGALTFEAGFGINNQIELCVVSKPFRDSISDILSKLSSRHVSMKKQSSNYWKLWSGNLTKEEALRWIELFEVNTEKWFRLRDHVKGYSRKVISFDETIQILSSIYPAQSPSKITLEDVLKAINNLKQACRYEIVDYLIENKKIKSFGGKWAHSLKPYLDLLKKANIILVKKGKFGPKKSFGTIIREVYIFNENIEEWRLPERNIS